MLFLANNWVRFKKSFRARGYYVRTVGLDEPNVREYIRNQDLNEAVEDGYDGDLSDSFQAKAVHEADQQAMRIPQLSRDSHNLLKRNEDIR